MNLLKTYGIPAILIIAVALLVCLALWGGYQNSESAASEAPAAETEVVGAGGEDRGDMGAAMVWIASILKQSILMVIPGLITWVVLRTTRRSKKAHA